MAACRQQPLETFHSITEKGKWTPWYPADSTSPLAHCQSIWPSRQLQVLWLSAGCARVIVNRIVLEKLTALLRGTQLTATTGGHEAS